MMRRLVTRLFLGMATLFVIVTLSFFLQRAAPGGPFDRDRELAPETRAALEAEWLLDRPLFEQYTSYLRGLCRWPPDFKRSMVRPDYTVAELIAPRLGVSLSLGLVTLVFALAVGIPLGVAAAMRHRQGLDHAAMLLALIGISVPSFVLGPLLKWIFALKLGWLPESRWVSAASLVLPMLALSAVYVATIARLVRAGLIEALDEPYVRTARAKGLGEARVLFVHALPAALLPVVSWLGPALAGLATGSVVIERVFDIPGLGNTFVDAAFNRDYTLVMATVVTYSAILIAANVATDLAAAWLDPRGEDRS